VGSDARAAFSWRARAIGVKRARMTDTPPDRLSTDPSSPYFDQPALERGIGIRFKGKQRHDVEEYDRAAGWIRVALGKKVDRHGRPLTIKLTGEVEAWFERPAPGAEAEDSAEG
jgi:hypothetical protein